MNNKLKVKSIVDGIDKISYSREGDASMDLRASGVWVIDLDSEKKEIISDEYEIKINERILIKTGIKVAIPQGYFGSIRDRSGLGFKEGLTTIGGVIDETYRGEIGVILFNTSKKPYKLTKNERVAQLIIQKYEKVDIEYVDELDETNRSQEGFGSSGKH